MAGQTETGPSTAPVTTTTPCPAVQHHPEGSSSEANLWAQVATSDEGSTSTFQLPELQPRPSTPPTDWVSEWLSNYKKAQPDAPVDPPPVSAPALTNIELEDDIVDLGAWDPPSSIPKPPAPTVPRWVPMPSPSVGMQPDGSPGPSRSSWTTATPPRAPTPFWNPFQSSATQWPPVPARGRDMEFRRRSSVKREFFLPHSAPVTTPYDLQSHSSGNPIFTANAFGRNRGSPARGSGAFPHPNANSFMAIPGFAAACSPSWSLPAAPVGNWATNRAWGNGEEALSAFGVPFTSFGIPVGGMPPWDPRALELLAGKHAAFQTGESSEPSRNRTHLAIEPIGGPPMLWNHSPSIVTWSTGTGTGAGKGDGTGAGTGEALKEVLARGPALNTNGKPRANRGSASDPQSVYARYRREKINRRMRTLQGLIPNGIKVDIVTMLDEAHNYVKFLEHQVELLKSDENWKFATPSIYKGIDLCAPGVFRR